MNSHGKDVLQIPRVNNKVNMFNRTIQNIMSNYIVHKTIICDVSDPAWISND